MVGPWGLHWHLELAQLTLGLSGWRHHVAGGMGWRVAALLLLHRWRSRVGLLLLTSILIGILRRRPVCAGRGIVMLTHIEGRVGSDALCSLLAEIDRKLTRGCGGASMPENKMN